ncbi:bifunctional allantoicase/(S)-ureidoglycine aminohydrolase [Marivivens aquimaris]|uniref:bifunctional allantoicase/(S)-ureidoglycine aminohydrolase n=1 Tax=Marivivens aquimaris TaxID=2774876 RepID=UPI001880C1FD|nr:bifunctional allantoicase/(S)-ureidoglycine aminohydrolase [Marivivens aquimaris]
MTYAFPPGGMPPLTEDPASNGAHFTESYAFIPASTMRDITSSLLPNWVKTRCWIIARPMTGFAETFAQYAVEIEPNGGSDKPEPDRDAEGVLFIAEGKMEIIIAGETHVVGTGGYVYCPPATRWTLRNASDEKLRFHWIRRRYVHVDGYDNPRPFVTSDADQPVHWMPGTDKWGTTRFVSPDDLRHDMHVNIVTFKPGGQIPFAETHVMEHGLYVLQGTAKYLLNERWVDVGPGDFMWLRAFCPQACIATGDVPFRYLLYKDVNRHPSLTL